MDDKIKINLQMVGFNYPLTVDRKDEGMVREAAKRVDKSFGEFCNRFPRDVSQQKILGMVAHAFALKVMQHEQRNDTKPLVDKISELTQLLDNHFEE